MAYAARYGHQPVSELKAMTERELRLFVEEIARIVKEENGDE